MATDSFDAQQALAPLKQFQRRTVDYVFARLYGSEHPVRQFLVADEVGLGKTMVARGVIARAIEHLWDKAKRIDILYICSNQAIAAQNINRLNVLGNKDLALPTRMTLLPLQLRGASGLAENRVNFISLTPGTTFDLRSSTGVVEERALIYRLLEELIQPRRGLQNLLQVDVTPQRWEVQVGALTLEGIDEGIIERFRRDVTSQGDLVNELKRLAELFHRRRESYPTDMRTPRNALIGRLRALLSHACVDALQPDLIIMDEFQRFRELLHGDSDAALLAREFFSYVAPDGIAARTLLLSATPYKMLTLAGESSEEGDHYEDFIKTLAFLYGPERGTDVAESLSREMRSFRHFLHGLPEQQAAAVATRERIERNLRQVMARTERVESTAARDSMVIEPAVRATLTPFDLAQASAVDEIARLLDAPQIIEYWKSTPYLLSFMHQGSYVLRRSLEEQLTRPSATLQAALKKAIPLMLDRNAIDSYQEIDPGNGRMRALMKDVIDGDLFHHLWIPPSLPYYGEARSSLPPTKALVFSSWSMVPDAIAALVSYEGERRMGVGESGRRYFDKHRGLLQFKRDDGRLSGLRTLLLLYPSATLAELGDPLAVFATHKVPLDEASMRDAVRQRLTPAIEQWRSGVASEGSIPAPEWAAPALLDAHLSAESTSWIVSPGGLVDLAWEDAYRDHVAELATVAAGGHYSPSEQLINLLVDVALGSPAICALRALRRVAPDLAWNSPELRNAAAKVAWAFRTLYNQHDAVALLRQGSEERYWHRVLTFGAEQNLQAVLDEYAHYLVDAEGLVAKPPAERVSGVAKAMIRALSIRPSQIDVETLGIDGERIATGKFQMRGRLAMRLGDYQAEDEKEVQRVGGVRDAFNSPFKPFVLATTSIGQEGLDFHPYCYRVYHWNLPSNPVDLEQREGRVHRFKGHAVRLNIAEKQARIVRGTGEVPYDPWQTMFAAARAGAATTTDLVPYWIYEGSVSVERRVPLLPFSREVTRLAWLKRSLTIYRLAFGQPRQDDLIEYLQGLADRGMDPASIEELQIRLNP